MGVWFAGDLFTLDLLCPPLSLFSFIFPLLLGSLTGCHVPCPNNHPAWDLRLSFMTELINLSISFLSMIYLSMVSSVANLVVCLKLCQICEHEKQGGGGVIVSLRFLLVV